MVDVLGFVTCAVTASQLFILKASPLKEIIVLTVPGLAAVVVDRIPECAILLPDCVITELPTVELPVNTGIVPEVPVPVIVCADALTVSSISQCASRRLFICNLSQPFSFSAVGVAETI